jgi:hypothetical protein
MNNRRRWLFYSKTTFMKNSSETFLQSAGIEVKHWWMLLASGFVCIILGLLAAYYQADSYGILTLLFGVAIFVSGVSQTTMAIINQNFLFQEAG